jgi:hypothetical protein
MFSGVYGKIDHTLNGTDHRALKKAHGIGIGAARDGGTVANHGRIYPQFPIGCVNPHDHHSTFSDIGSGRLVNCQELAFSRLSPIQEYCLQIFRDIMTWFFACQHCVIVLAHQS